MTVMPTRKAFRTGRTRSGIAVLGLVLGGSGMCLSLNGVSQTAGINQGGPGYIHSQVGGDPGQQSGTPQGNATLEQMRQAERHRRIAADAARLLQLSSELKTEIDQTPKDQLSLDAVRKAGEIEKLAHDVKQWMKY